MVKRYSPWKSQDPACPTIYLRSRTPLSGARQSWRNSETSSPIQTCA